MDRLIDLTLAGQLKSTVNAEGPNERKMSVDKEERRDMKGEDEEAYGLG